MFYRNFVIMVSIIMLLGFVTFDALSHTEDSHDHGVAFGEGHHHDVNGFADSDHSNVELKPPPMTLPHNHWVGQPLVTHRINEEPVYEEGHPRAGQIRTDHGSRKIGSTERKDDEDTSPQGYHIYKETSNKFIIGGSLRGYLEPHPPDHVWDGYIKSYVFHSHKLKPGHEHIPGVDESDPQPEQPIQPVTEPSQETPDPQPEQPIQPVTEQPQESPVVTVDDNTQTEPQSEPEVESVEEQNWVYASKPGQIGFSELMFASKGGLHSRAQWIELYNNSDTFTINLSGHKLVIEARDEDGTYRYGEILLRHLTIEPESTALLATWNSKNSGHFENNRYMLNRDWLQFEQNQYRNMVLGLSGFYMKLESRDGIVIDEAGNLDGDSRTQDLPAWELPDIIKDNRNRVSLSRRYDVTADIPLDGKIKENWKPTSNFTDSSDRYWGRPNDIGTPGYRNKDKALPVELAYFGAKLVDGNVVITWTTESELNNAGFNIFRSENIGGKFQSINTALIPGQGTASEKTEYSWSDRTAKSNTQYYYRIQEVSLDGQAQIISQAIMKGYVSPKDKLPLMWAEIKQ